MHASLLATRVPSPALLGGYDVSNGNYDVIAVAVALILVKKG